MSKPDYIKTIPVPLHGALTKASERLDENPDWPEVLGLDSVVASVLPRVLACSEYVADVLARYPESLAEIIRDGRIHRSMRPGELEAVVGSAVDGDENEAAFMQRLRRFRHRELMRIAFRDYAGWSDCEETLEELSTVADVCIRCAFHYSCRELERKHGRPLTADGTTANFIIIAMGKLGGGELNFSSDVDLVFLYSGSGETDGARALTNEEYFRRLAQHFINLLSRKTADGFVYRVDARLRPFGDSGPLACSVDAFEDYLQQHGRDWERYAWIKARAVNSWEGTREFYANVLRPFVYRRYLDFGVFGSLREMKSMIEQEARAAENRENIKLGPGGIREIEFIVQTLQLVRGGTIRNLRQRSLMPTLEQLGEVGLMPAETSAELACAYRFLRDLENRLQAIADRQTHELPAGELDRARLCLAMNFASWAELHAELNRHRAIVKADFDRILRHERGAKNTDDAAPETPGSVGQAALQSIAEQAFADPDGALERIQALQSGAHYQRMDEVGRQRLDRLLPAVLAVCGGAANGMRALDGTLRVIESIGRRSAYIALLNENAAALERLVRLVGSSDFLARQVAAHPLLLDELLDQRIFSAAPARSDLEHDLGQRLAGAGEDDTEQRFEALRNFQQAAVFRVAVADMSGILPLMKVSDRLTDIAELVLAEALAMSMAELVQKHGRPMCVADGVAREARFGIAGYGKLGGLELGYGSDLDIVFMHDSSGESQQTDGENSLDNAVFFGRLARRITHILTMPTPTGALYEVDTRLRPSGNSGLLVTSLAALDSYQRSDAWTWEHQALLRSRAVAGGADICGSFEALRVHALTNYVRRGTLRDEVLKMRERMREQLNESTAERFDIKQGLGGLIDIEFLVQYLVLLHAPGQPALVEYSDNIRQLDALQAAEIITPTEADGLADAYRDYRGRMHQLSLAGETRFADPDEFAGQRAMVSALWKQHLAD